MADFFDKKNYSDYFNELNHRFETKTQEHAAPVKKSQPRRKKKKGIYKTVRIRKMGCLAVAAILLAGVVFAISASVSGKDAKKNPAGVSSVSAGEQEIEAGKNETKTEKITVPEIFFTTDTDTTFIPETNQAKNAIVVRRSDRRVIAQRNAHTRISPASTMKIMTLLVAVEHIRNFEDTFTMSYAITDPLFRAQASVAGFLNDEAVSMNDLLYGLILPSGGDAAMGLAVKIAGSEEAFVELMNQKAEELGLINTHFTNVVGLYDEENYSSAYDIAVILEAALQNELCRQILSTRTYTTTATAQHPNGIALVSTLFSRLNGNEAENADVLGGKTGFVDEAGYCIASFGENADGIRDYLVVTMGSATRQTSVSEQIDLYKTFVK